MATFAIEIGKQLPISLVKRNQYNVRGHLDPNTWVLEIHCFAIRGFSFPPKPANCKDPPIRDRPYMTSDARGLGGFTQI